MITTYLEMREHPRLQVRGPQRGGCCSRLEERPFPSTYLHGAWAGSPHSRASSPTPTSASVSPTRPWTWFVFYLGGAPAGFFEFDRRQEGEVRLVRLGLFPEFRAGTWGSGS